MHQTLPLFKGINGFVNVYRMYPGYSAACLAIRKGCRFIASGIPARTCYGQLGLRQMRWAASSGIRLPVQRQLASMAALSR
ncbi:Beta- N-acetylglucosaminidase [Pseudomonas syringae pv. actinidiae]|uniref:Beta-N-acetylglucosaminidase n=1 Tax=Pseudomonas syringae pv. actinidiae TaxID=103796 RepID=A0A2V0QG18_PSESF|nr:Beta- N-acetylglucosaminidase [Pseudomonas syringae pv. actinidiae]